MQYNILVVDDEKDIRTILSEILEDEGYNAVTCASSSECIDIIKKQSISLVILDVWLGENDLDGIMLLDKIKTINKNLPVIMMSGHSSIEIAIKAIKKGAYDFVEKPFSVDKFLICLRNAFDFFNLVDENYVLKQHIDDDIIGEDLSFIKILSKAKSVAADNRRVLITGERGVGKTLIAKHIHKISNYKNKPMLSTDCMLVDKNTIDAELFGNYKNDCAYLGLFDRAYGGILLIENIHCLGIDMQRKLLVMMSNKDVMSNIKLLITASDEIFEMLKKGSFSEILFNQINISNLKIAPLRTRKKDIISIMKYFLNKMTKIEFENIDGNVLKFIESYNWPYNVKEMKNFVEWIEIIGLENVSIETLPMIGNSQIKNFNIEYLSYNLKEAKDNFEKDYIQLQVQRFNGNMTKISNIMDVDRSSLYRKMKQLGIKNI